MKLLVDPIIGKVRGRIGDFVVKQLNGKTYISKRPSPRSKSSFSDAERAKQKRFAMNCKLSTAINKIDVLRPLWHKVANGKMSSHNAISKSNYPLFGYNEFLIAPKLTPDSISINISTIDFKYNDGKISITFRPDTFGLIQNFNSEKSVMAIGILYLSNPVYDFEEKYKFIGIKSDSVEISKGKDFVLSIKPDSFTEETLKSYSKCTFFFGFISLDKDGKAKRTVSTFTEVLFGNAD